MILDGPHRIKHNDRFKLGHYMVVAEVGAADAMPKANSESPSMLQMPPIGGGASSSSSSAGTGLQAPAWSAPPPPPADDDPWGDFAPAVEPVNPGTAGAGGSAPPAAPQAEFHQEFMPTPAAVPMPPPEAGSYPRPPQQAPGAGGGGDGDAVIRAFCEGAGLPAGTYQNADAEALAHALGQSVRAASEEIMGLLRERGDVKHFMKAGERTMRSRTGNNPMKFLPDPAKALEAMYLKPLDGFNTGPEAFQNSLRDIRRHQTAVFAALQPALAKVLSGLSPEEIEDSASSGILGGVSKGKSWDTYVERWDSKANAGENGILDAFLEAFAAAYAEASGKSEL